MKKICFVIVMFAFFLLYQGALADTYKINYGSPRDGSYNGGPFTIEINPPAGQVYTTFCLERNEFFTPGATYYGTIDDNAIKGGLKGGPNDPLDPLSEWLYANRLADSLTTAAKSRAMQEAIWYIEEEIDILPAGQATTYYNLAVDANPSDISWIKVLNIYHYVGTTKVDDQSMIIPVPEPGILILLGIAMSAIGMASWRIRKL